MGLDAMIFVFWMLSFMSVFSLSSFIFIKRLFSSFFLSAIRVVSSAYLRLLIFLLAILIPACASFSPAFCMTYSAYKLNKQGDNIQPWQQECPNLFVNIRLQLESSQFCLESLTHNSLARSIRALHGPLGLSNSSCTLLPFCFWVPVKLPFLSYFKDLYLMLPLPETPLNQVFSWPSSVLSVSIQMEVFQRIWLISFPKVVLFSHIHLVSFLFFSGHAMPCWLSW